MMKPRIYEVSGILEMFSGYTANWTYLFIPFTHVPDVDPGGWGAIPVEVTLGESSWTTSIFPLKKDGYFLPVKRPILKKENVAAGDKVSVKYFTTRGVFA